MRKPKPRPNDRPQSAGDINFARSMALEKDDRPVRRRKRRRCAGLVIVVVVIVAVIAWFILR